ncbi:unnamed protein product [Ectocarpus fasciculatus]
MCPLRRNFASSWPHRRSLAWGVSWATPRPPCTSSESSRRSRPSPLPRRPRAPPTALPSRRGKRLMENQFIDTWPAMAVGCVHWWASAISVRAALTMISAKIASRRASSPSPC